jgi:hypothetical protein
MKFTAGKHHKLRLNEPAAGHRRLIPPPAPASHPPQPARLTTAGLFTHRVDTPP